MLEGSVWIWMDIYLVWFIEGQTDLSTFLVCQIDCDPHWTNRDLPSLFLKEFLGHILLHLMLNCKFFLQRGYPTDAVLYSDPSVASERLTQRLQKSEKLVLKSNATWADDILSQYWSAWNHQVNVLTDNLLGSLSANTTSVSAGCLMHS